MQLDAGHLEVGRAHARRQLAAARDPLHGAARPRALHRQHRPAVVRVRDLDVEVAGVLGEPGEVLVVVRRVRDGEEAVLAEPVGEQVVEHAAVLAAQHAVLRAPLRDLRDVVREHALEEVLGLRPARLDLAHVRDVEHARAGAHRHVLLADALVLDRHLPPGEGHEPRPGALVALEQRGPAEGVGGRHGPPGGYPLRVRRQPGARSCAARAAPRASPPAGAGCPDRPGTCPERSRTGR